MAVGPSKAKAKQYAITAAPFALPVSPTFTKAGEIPLVGADYASLLFEYTQGAATAQLEFYLETIPEDGLGYGKTIIDGSTLGRIGVTNLFRADAGVLVVRYPSIGAAAVRRYEHELNTNRMKRASVWVAEFNGSGGAGTVSISMLARLNLKG